MVCRSSLAVCLALLVAASGQPGRLSPRLVRWIERRLGAAGVRPLCRSDRACTLRTGRQSLLGSSPDAGRRRDGHPRGAHLARGDGISWRRQSSGCFTGCSAGPSVASARRWPIHRAGGGWPPRRWSSCSSPPGASARRFPVSFPAPVVATYARQASLVLAGWRHHPLPPSPVMESTFANLDGADVYLVFIESYGAVSNRPDLASQLAASRAAARRRHPR